MLSLHSVLSSPAANPPPLTKMPTSLPSEHSTRPNTPTCLMTHAVPKSIFKAIVRTATLTAITLVAAVAVLGCGGASSTASRAQDTTVTLSAEEQVILDRVIGDTSQSYNERGFKGMSLGRTFEELNKETPLTKYDLDMPCLLSDAPDLSRMFCFSADGRLVTIAKRYEGGEEDYLDEIVDTFGKTTQPIEQSSSSDRTSRSSRTSIYYSFPEVLSEVNFYTTVKIIYGNRQEESDTNVIVTDRLWAEQILAGDIKRKQESVAWLKTAIAKAIDPEWKTSQAPALANALVLASTSDVSYVGTSHYESLKKNPRYSSFSENDYSRASECARCGVDRSGVSAVPYAVIIYSKWRQCVPSDMVKTVSGEGVDALYHSPLLPHLATKATFSVLQAAFPPDSETPTSRNEEPHRLTGSRKWLHTTAEGTALEIECFDIEDAVRISARTPKKL